jgi:hypothetical protein
MPTPGKWVEALEQRTYCAGDLSSWMSIASQSPKPVVAVKAVRLFPNYVGTYAGTVVIKKGLDKGLVFSQTVTNTSENRTTGVITFVGTDYFSNGTTLSFAGQTTVKRTGAFVAYALDVPPDSAGTTKDVGKYTGLKSKGTYANLLNSGTFNDTFEG